jgi:hypothetical protein
VYPWVAKVFLRIWPIPQDGNLTDIKYWDVWKSFPLAVDETQYDQGERRTYTFLLEDIWARMDMEHWSDNDDN